MNPDVKVLYRALWHMAVGHTGLYGNRGNAPTFKLQRNRLLQRSILHQPQGLAVIRTIADPNQEEGIHTLAARAERFNPL